MKSALITGITGQDGSYLAEFPALEGVPRRRHGAPLERRPLRAPRAHPERHRADPGRPDGPDVARHRRPRRPARRDLQPRRAVVRADVVEPAGSHRRGHRSRCHARARGHAQAPPRGALLPGEQLRDVRQGRRGRRSARTPRSTRAAPTAWRRCTGTGSRSTTASRTTCSAARASCSTTRARGAASSSSAARSATPSRASRRASRRSSRWATSTRGGTGVSPATTSRRCGSCSSRTRPLDYVVATGKSHSVKDLLDAAFSAVGLNWEGLRRDRPPLLPPRRGRHARRRPDEGARGSRLEPARVVSRS